MTSRPSSSGLWIALHSTVPRFTARPDGLGREVPRCCTDPGTADPRTRGWVFVHLPTFRAAPGLVLAVQPDASNSWPANQLNSRSIRQQLRGARTGDVHDCYRSSEVPAADLGECEGDRPSTLCRQKPVGRVGLPIPPWIRTLVGTMSSSAKSNAATRQWCPNSVGRHVSRPRHAGRAGRPQIQNGTQTYGERRPVTGRSALSRRRSGVRILYALPTLLAFEHARDVTKPLLVTSFPRVATSAMDARASRCCRSSASPRPSCSTASGVSPRLTTIVRDRRESQNWKG